jgi:hypothetical protein
MIKKISFLAAAITMILVSIVFAQNNSLSFGEVVDNLNLAKNTSLAVETYWLEIKGAEVTWSGEVVDVKGGKGKAKISIANKNRSTYKGYNIVLETFDMEGAAKLKIGQDVRFNGLISDYKGKKGNPIIVYLNSVEFK